MDLLHADKCGSIYIEARVWKEGHASLNIPLWSNKE